jgi:transposase
MKSERGAKARDLWVQVVTLFKEGYSHREIAEKIGKGKSYVTKTLKRYNETGTIDRKAGSGRPKLLSEKDRRLILKKVDEEPKISAAKLANIVSEATGKMPCPQTMRNLLNEEGFHGSPARKVPLLSKKNVLDRFRITSIWSLKTLSFWDRIMFSDETKFNLISSDGRVMAWKKQGESLKIKNCVQTVKHGGISVMAWGCMSSRGVGRLVFINGKMDSLLYRRILSENLELSRQEMGLPADFIYQQDNDPKHMAAKTRDFFAENSIQLLEWPSQSPDLNPIEHLWAFIKTKLRLTPMKNRSELEKKIQEIWNGITPEFCKKLVYSMPKRIEEVQRNKGWHTGY